MSVHCEQFIGYTLTVKKKLNHDDYEALHKFLDTYPEYDERNKDNKLTLIIDGLNGMYARFVYSESHIRLSCCDEDVDYVKLNVDKPNYDIYKEFNVAYRRLFGTKAGCVNSNNIEYAMWFHYA